MPDSLIAALPNAQLPTPQLASAREYLVRAATHLWRVQDRREHVLGHVRIVADPRGPRYRAERLHLTAGGFCTIGEFWNVDDAVAALRYG